jgi:hypothetical protein
MRTCFVSLLIALFASTSLRSAPPRADDSRVETSDRLAIAWFGSLLLFEHGSHDAQSLLLLFSQQLSGLARVEPIEERRALAVDSILFFDELGLDRSDPVVLAAERTIVFAVEGRGDIDRILIGIAGLTERSRGPPDYQVEGEQRAWLLALLRQYVEP